MLKIQQLRFSYHAQKDEPYNDLNMCFNLEVNAGEILSVIGASGSGKSTLLNLIAGFEQATSGEIFINNKDISQQTIAQRPVTTVFQEHNLFPHLNIFSNVAIGIKPSLKLSQDETHQVNQALDNVGLLDYTKRTPAQLSGGQRQRVALARALVREHDVLLLDEPLAALGPAMRDEIIDLLKEIVINKNIMALLVSHQPSDALRASKRVAFIHEGEVLEVSDTEKMLNHSKKPEIQQYLGQL
ncbi:MAG: ATP-binding cassette domain-containing protein [Cocleimonas sp.]